MEKNKNRKEGKVMKDYSHLEKLLEQDFKPMCRGSRAAFIEKPQIVKDIIARLKKEEELTYVEAYGVLQLTKEYLEYEANYLVPLALEKEL